MQGDREQPITVMVPLGNIGSRFQKEGYTKPKRSSPCLASR